MSSTSVGQSSRMAELHLLMETEHSRAAKLGLRLSSHADGVDTEHSSMAELLLCPPTHAPSNGELLPCLRRSSLRSRSHLCHLRRCTKMLDSALVSQKKMLLTHAARRWPLEKRGCIQRTYSACLRIGVVLLVSLERTCMRCECNGLHAAWEPRRRATQVKCCIRA